MSLSGKGLEYINKLFKEDNLELLRRLPDECIDLIYCDILYNTGRKFNDYDDNDMASLIQGSANAASERQGEITNFKKKKIAGYQGIIFDYTVESDSVSVKERAMAIANKKAKKLVMLIAVENNGDDSGLSIINTIAKTAKKK